jgi:hypothetical protein
MKVSSLSLNKEELLSLCQKLQERSNAAAEIEINNYSQNDLSDEQYEINKKTLREGFDLRITICGSNGEELWGSIQAVFNSVNFPERITSFYVDSESTLRYGHNYFPHNSFKIFLDFSKLKVFDFSFLPSQGTPNESNVEVKGHDATWVNGVFSEIANFIKNKGSTLSIVHNHSVYDVLLWLLGFPLGFWVCNKLSLPIEHAFHSSFATNALYLYVFVATLFGFRILFHYLRWVCPLVEYRSIGNKMLIHRAVLGAASISIGSTFYMMFLNGLSKVNKSWCRRGS